MEPEYILLICAGGVLFILLLAYAIAAIRKRRSRQRSKSLIIQSYSEDNLHKMEYDVAFYEGEAFKIFTTGDVAQQVTIDDVLGSSSQDLTEMTQKAIFSQLEDDGGEEIKGKFNPAK